MKVLNTAIPASLEHRSAARGARSARVRHALAAPALPHPHQPLARGHVAHRAPPGAQPAAAALAAVRAAAAAAACAFLAGLASQIWIQVKKYKIGPL